MSTDDIPGLAAPGGHYAHATVGGGFVFVAGQLPIAPDGRKLVGAPLAEQIAQVPHNVRCALESNGSSIDKLVQVRVYLTRLDDWAEFNRMYAAWAGNARPARAIVSVTALHFGLALEVEAVGRLE